MLKLSQSEDLDTNLREIIGNDRQKLSDRLNLLQHKDEYILNESEGIADRREAVTTEQRKNFQLALELLPTHTSRLDRFRENLEKKFIKYFGDVKQIPCPKLGWTLLGASSLCSAILGGVSGTDISYFGASIMLAGREGIALLVHYSYPLWACFRQKNFQPPSSILSEISDKEKETAACILSYWCAVLNIKDIISDRITEDDKIGEVNNLLSECDYSKAKSLSRNIIDAMRKRENIDKSEA